jgi:hypothetical protein
VAAACAATSAVPAAATPLTETVATDAATEVKADATVLQLEPGAEVISAGPTGFTSSEKDGDVRWTRYADGSSMVLTRQDGQAKESEYYGAFSDTVVMPQSMTEFSRYPDGATVYEPASGAAPVTIDLRTLSRSHRYFGAAKDIVIAASATAEGERAHLVTRNDTSLSDRAVTGLPAGALDIHRWSSWGSFHTPSTTSASPSCTSSASLNGLSPRAFPRAHGRGGGGTRADRRSARQSTGRRGVGGSHRQPRLRCAAVTITVSRSPIVSVTNRGE